MILESEFIRLEILNSDHLNQLKPFANHKEIWAYTIEPMECEEDMENYTYKALQGHKDGHQLPFVVIEKSTNRIVGMTRLYEIDKTNNKAKLGYTWYDKSVQGTKVNKTCKLLLLNYAFYEMNLNRIEFNADLRNERSIKAMKSIGAEQEGILKKHTILPNGYLRDTIILSILKEGWKGGLKEKLIQKIG